MMNFEGLSQLKAEFWLNLVRVLKQNNKESDAKSILIQTKLLDLFDKNFYQLELELKNTDSSEKYVILNDLDLSLKTKLIKDLNTGDLQKLLNKCLKIEVFFRRKVTIKTIEAAVRLKLKQTERAISTFHTIQKIEPKNSAILNNLGLAYFQNKEFEKAIDAYERACKLNSNYADALNNKGVALNELQEFKKAINSYKKAIALKPDYALAYFNLGNVYKQQNKISLAIKSYQQAIVLNNKYSDAYYNLGLLAQLTGEKNKAMELYKKALEYDPGLQK